MQNEEFPHLRGFINICYQPHFAAICFETLLAEMDLAGLGATAPIAARWRNQPGATHIFLPAEYPEALFILLHFSFLGGRPCLAMGTRRGMGETPHSAPARARFIFWMWNLKNHPRIKIKGRGQGVRYCRNTSIQNPTHEQTSYYPGGK